MTIISQEKNKIINYKNVTNINIEQEDNKFIIKCYFDIGNICIGKYETEERAKEILQELINKTNSQKYILKPKVPMYLSELEDEKEYYEKTNNIDVIICDVGFDIIPVGNNEEIVYEMPER